MHKIKLLVLILLFFVVQAKACPEKSDTLYALNYKPGPAWQKGIEIWNQDLAAHGEYMKSLNDKGLIKVAGPFTDSSGGMAILCTTKEAAIEILSKDPSITKGVFVGEVKEWYIAFQ